MELFPVLRDQEEAEKRTTRDARFVSRAELIAVRARHARQRAAVS